MDRLIEWLAQLWARIYFLATGKYAMKVQILRNIIDVQNKAMSMASEQLTKRNDEIDALKLHIAQIEAANSAFGEERDALELELAEIRGVLDEFTQRLQAVDAILDEFKPVELQ